MKFSRSIIWKTYSIKRSMQKFFESGHFSRGKGFRCHKKRNRFRERTTVTHSQVDRLAWKWWSNTINDQMKPIHRRWVDIWSQGDNLVNQVAEWSPSAVVWDRFLRWALMKSRKHSGVYKHLLFWSLNRQIFNRPHSMLFIIETKRSQRQLQIESATASINGLSIVLKIHLKPALL